MFNWIREWLAERERKAAAKSYSNGYFYANQVLRDGGPKMIKSLRDCIARESDFGKYTDFERGVDDAIRIYLRERILQERIKLVQKNHG